jgi:hypothetical protein
MNKTVVIIGSIALLGVGAYFYFKPKAKGATGAGTTDAGTTGTGGMGALTGTTGAIMPPAGTVFTTPEEVEAITVKISTARDLTKKICDLKAQYKITTDEMNDFMNFTGVNQSNTAFSNLPISIKTQQMITYQLARKKAIPTVAEAINKLKELGYKEVDCKMVKIA